MAITKLPPLEQTFTIEVKGDETGKIFSGTFTYKKPNIKAKSDIAKTKAALDGGFMLDAETDFLHRIYATLRHTLIDFPEWWEEEDYGFSLLDTNVALEIYKETIDFEKSWRDAIQTGNSEKSSKTQGKQSKKQSEA